MEWNSSEVPLLWRVELPEKGGQSVIPPDRYPATFESSFTALHRMLSRTFVPAAIQDASLNNYEKKHRPHET